MCADGDGVARIDLGELVDDHDVRQVIHPRSAELVRPRDPEQAEVRHLLDIVPGKAALEVVLAGGGLHDVAGEVSDHLAPPGVLVGEVEALLHPGIWSRLPQRLPYHGATIVS